MFKTPSDIQYGVVRDMLYLPEFGRFEAKVVLRIMGEGLRSPDVQFMVNVPARKDEPFADLHMRLVLKAARLFRIHESESRAVETSAEMAA